MPRMRTAGSLLELIKAQDPETEVTLHYLRQLIKSGAIPTVAVGRKKLVDADAVLAHLSTGDALTPPAEVAQVGSKIRRVPV